MASPPSSPTIPYDKTPSTIKEILQQIQKNLYRHAETLKNTNFHRIHTLEKAEKLHGIIELPWCGTEECALEIETILDGNTLGEPIDKQPCDAPCPHCGKQGISWMRYAKTY